jgi:hypothetical protein
MKRVSDSDIIKIQGEMARVGWFREQEEEI